METKNIYAYNPKETEQASVFPNSCVMSIGG